LIDQDLHIIFEIFQLEGLLTTLHNTHLLQVVAPEPIEEKITAVDERLVAKEFNLPPGDYDHGQAWIVISKLDNQKKEEKLFRVVYEEPFNSLELHLLVLTGL